MFVILVFTEIGQNVRNIIKLKIIYTHEKININIKLINFLRQIIFTVAFLYFALTDIFSHSLYYFVYHILKFFKTCSTQNKH